MALPGWMGLFRAGNHGRCGGNAVVKATKPGQANSETSAVRIEQRAPTQANVARGSEGSLSMPASIGVAEVQKMLVAGAQLVDVLPEGEFTELHLPGAVNIPLKKMTAEATERLDRSQPVIVYCHDFQ